MMMTAHSGRSADPRPNEQPEKHEGANTEKLFTNLYQKWIQDQPSQLSTFFQS